MADPIIQDHYRVQTVMQGESGLAEDRFVMNWIFRNDNTLLLPIEGIAVSVKNILDAFYADTPAITNRSIASFFGPGITSVEYRLYDLGQGPPREPIVVPTEWLPTGNDALPREVAACMSITTEKRGPRGRGRIFLGPLSTATMTQNNGDVRVAQVFRDTVQDRALDVINTTQNATWCVLSQVDAQTHTVTGGWIDDAFDTQRSRGAKPSDRQTWYVEQVPIG